MPIICPTFAGICLFFRHTPVTQGVWGFEGVVPELVHSVDPAIWGQTANKVGSLTWQWFALKATMHPKIACWMLN
jgi:hypothetical protein